MDLRNLKSNKVIKFGDPFWLVVCIGRNKGRAHWTDGSVLAAKADKGIYVPVVPLDPKSEAMGDLGTGVTAESDHEVLGVPGPVSATLDFETSSIEMFNNSPSRDITSVEFANKIPLETGKFIFRPAGGTALSKKVEIANAKGEYTEICNLNEGFLEQDFFVISRGESRRKSLVSLLSFLTTSTLSRSTQSLEPGWRLVSASILWMALI